MSGLHDAGLRRLSLWAVLGFVLVAALQAMAGLLQPLFVAAFLYYATLPFFRWLVAHKVPRPLAYVVPAAAAALVLLVSIWLVAGELQLLAERFPAYRAALQDRLAAAVAAAASWLPAEDAERLRGYAAGRGLSAARVEAAIPGMLGGFFSLLATAVLVVFYLVFIIHEGRSLPERLRAAYGAAQAARLLQIGERINRSLQRYVFVKGLASLLVGVLSWAAMAAFGLELALLWAGVIFFGNFIPYVGSAAAVLFPILVGVAQFESWTAVLSLAAALLSLQTLVGYWFEPVIGGHAVDLSPLAVMLTLSFWGWLWGLTGLLLSVPLLAAAKLVLEQIPATRHLAVLMSEFPGSRGR